VQVFGYSARKVDRDLHSLIYLNCAGPPTVSDMVWASLVTNPGDSESRSQEPGTRPSSR
jgi:hypothetical protein